MKSALPKDEKIYITHIYTGNNTAKEPEMLCCAKVSQPVKHLF